MRFLGEKEVRLNEPTALQDRMDCRVNNILPPCVDMMMKF
jgi:hypothetical protein